MKSLKRTLSVFLSALLLCGVFSAAGFTVSAEDLRQVEFIESLNTRFFPGNEDNKLTAKNLEDYVTVYRSDEKMTVFKIDIIENTPVSLLIDGYMFSSDTSVNKWSSNPGYYIYYPENEKYSDIISIKGAVSSGLITAAELADIIPNVKKMTQEDYIAHFKSFGYEVTSVTDLGGGVFYAVNEGKTREGTKDIEASDLVFHLKALASPDELGLFFVDGNYVSPVTENKDRVWEVDSLKLIENLRKAESDGLKLNFTAESKFGKKAEDCLRLIKEEYYPLKMTRFYELGDFCLFRCTTGGETCEDFQLLIGNYLFHCGSQTMPYDFGWYVVKDEKLYFLEKAYEEKVIDDADMDKIAEKINDMLTVKLTPEQKKFVLKMYSDRKCYFGYRDVLVELGEIDGCKLYYSDFREGLGIVNYGDYKIYISDEKNGIPLGLYLYRDGEFITVEQAWNSNFINEENVGKLVEILKNQSLKGLERLNIEDKKATEPTTQVPTADLRSDLNWFKDAGLIRLEKETYEYTGGEIIPEVIVRNNDEALIENRDYTLTYLNNKGTGTASVVITGIGDMYKGSVTLNFTIVAKSETEPTTEAVETTAPTEEPTTEAVETTAPTKEPMTEPVVREKKENTISVSVKTVSFKAKRLKKGKVSVKAVTVKNAEGKVSFKLKSVPKKLKKLVKINSKGVITFKKQAKVKKGLYKIKVCVTAKGNSDFKKGSVTGTVKIRIK